MAVGHSFLFERQELIVGLGETHAALILLYRAIDLPTAEEVKD